MNTTEFIWHNGKFVAWDSAQTHMLTHTLHYGGGAFEGIRAYQTKRGPAIFRAKEHFERLLYSSSALKMEVPYTVDALVSAAAELVRRNKVEHCYIRPITFYGYGVMGLRPYGAPVEVAIACWPWGAYLPHDMVDVKISSFVRIHPKSTVVDAKLCGHYVNSIMANLELRNTEYHEALLLDAYGNVAEGPGENIFLVKNGVLHTPQKGCILKGITRDTAMQIAAANNIQVIERDIKPEELFEAEEAFFTGTAAEVTPVRSIDKRLIGSGQLGPITKLVKETYAKTVVGEDARFEKFLTFTK